MSSQHFFLRFLAVFLLFTNPSITFAALSVRLEGKKYPEKSFLVFYHSDDLKVKAVAQGGKIQLSFDQPVEFSVKNSELVDTLAYKVKLSGTNQALEVSLKEQFIAQNVVHGEKLTAITLKDIESEVDKLAKQSNKEIEAKVADKNSRIQYSSTEDQRALYFPWQVRGVGATIFATESNIYIVFDKLKRFTTPDSSAKMIEGLRRINHPDSTIFALARESGVTYGVKKLGRGWSLIADTKATAAIAKSKISLVDRSTKNMYRILVKGSLTENTLVSFTDQRVSKNYIVLPLIGKNQYITASTSFNKVLTLPTMQGAAFELAAQDVVSKITPNGWLLTELKNSEQIVTPAASNKQVAKDDTKSPMSYDNLLPLVRKDQVSNEDFIQDRKELIAETIAAEDDEAKYKARLKLAEFYFSHTMYHESASMIEAMQIDAADLFAKSPYANFLYAVNMSIIKEYSRSVDYYKEARALYIKFTKKVPLELAMWQEYNDYKRGIYHNEIPVDEHLAGIVVNYPDSLYWKLVLADLEIYLQLGNLKRVEQVLENTRTPTHRKYADFLNYYAALYYKKKGNLTRAQEYLGNLERYSKDNRVITLATLERTRMLYDAGAISLAGAIQRLDSIRYHWRGDKLEYELLTQLADYYEKAGEVLLALRTYKYIKDAFANKINDLFITGQMVELYNKLFVHGRDIERLSDFEVISIFYEFKFLNPIGADGDDVILMIAKRMMNLDLLDNAISLLQHQVQYRLKGDKRVITAEHLATLYLMNDMPQRAIDILQNTDRDNIDFNRHIFRSRLKASAYAVLGRYSEALTLLEGDNSEHANSLRYDIFFRAGKWSDYIKGMEASILTKLASGEKVEDIDLIKIAVAYTNSGKFRALKNLRAMLKEPSTTVKAILDLLLLSNSPVDMGSVMKSMPIEKVPAMLQQYKSDLF